MGYFDNESYTISDIIEIIKDFYNHIPKLNPYFGYAWILCWFLSIWIFHMQLFLTGLFCLILSFIEFDEVSKQKSEVLPIIFSINKKDHSLVVDKVFNDKMFWAESEVCSGDALLPKGIIKVGDVVTECSGNVALRHAPTNIIFGAFNFE